MLLDIDILKLLTEFSEISYYNRFKKTGSIPHLSKCQSRSVSHKWLYSWTCSGHSTTTHCHHLH
jgi:hypothetical protein